MNFVGFEFVKETTYNEFSIEVDKKINFSVCLKIVTISKI